MCQAIDYLLVVEVVIDFLPTCLRSRQVRGFEKTTIAALLEQMMRRIVSLWMKMSPHKYVERSTQPDDSVHSFAWG
jgi:hypothetical protein